MNERLSKKNWFILFLFCFMGGIAWNTENMYFNTFITNDIYADVSRAAILGSMEATTAVARMVALSAIAAVVTTFLMGALSDKLKNRKLFISVGYLFWGAVTAVFGFITKENIATLFHLSDEATILGTTVWFVILMDIVMTFMGSTSNDAAFQAWVTDVTVPRQRPLVETVLSVVGTVSSFAVTGVGSFGLDMRFYATQADWSVLPRWLVVPPFGWLKLLTERGIAGAAMMALPLILMIVTFGMRLVGWLFVLTVPRPGCWIAPAVLLAVVATGFFDCSYLRVDVLMAVAVILALSASEFPKARKEGSNG